MQLTQNQLRYWELRWKQFYDMRLLEVERAKLAHEANKLAETIRHNKREERIETQRMVIERAKLSKEWAALSETIRSNIVNEGINAYKASETNRHNLKQEQLDYMTILGNQAIALGDLMKQAEDAKNKNTVQFIKAYGNNVGEFLKSFGGGAAATGVAELRAALGAESYDNIMQSVIDQFPQFSNLKTAGVAGVTYTPKSYTEQYGPEAPSKYKKDAEDAINDVKKSALKYPHDFSESGLVQGFSSSDLSNPTASTVSTGSVIISDTGKVPSHTSGGTDYTISGGHKSSGVIYA